MKRLLATLILIMCLSFPTYAGHVQSTGVACSCNTAGCIEDYEGECGGHHTNQQSTPSDLGSGTLLILAALLLGLKLRA